MSRVLGSSKERDGRLGLWWEWEWLRNYGCIIIIRCFAGYFSILIFLHKVFLCGNGVDFFDPMYNIHAIMIQIWPSLKSNAFTSRRLQFFAFAPPTTHSMQLPLLFP